MGISRTQKLLFTSVAAAGLAAGGLGIAGAVTTPSSSSAPSAATTDGTNEPSYQSSITVVDNGVESGGESGDAQLQGLATITPDQAAAAATAAVPGTAATPELENENGNVVYGVEVRTATGTVDVKVDAGNGAVVSQQSGDEHDAGPEAAGEPETADDAVAPR